MLGKRKISSLGSISVCSPESLQPVSKYHLLSCPGQVTVALHSKISIQRATISFSSKCGMGAQAVGTHYGPLGLHVLHCK